LWVQVANYGDSLEPREHFLSFLKRRFEEQVVHLHPSLCASEDAEVSHVQYSPASDAEVSHVQYNPASVYCSFVDDAEVSHVQYSPASVYCF
jgi:hypothetical protein